VIEAHFLFGLEYSQIDVVIHPESVIHSMAEFRDGSMMAQLSRPDMRLPIQLALAHPDRLSTGIGPLDLAATGSLTFETVDRGAFPALDLAYRAGQLGATYPAVMNAANEVTVRAFLEGTIRLTEIAGLTAQVVEEHEPASVVSAVSLERADGWARRRTAELIESR
jgi:1-deoxy-D-xylulose-5-phosphate reductoisomerase